MTTGGPGRPPLTAPSPTAVELNLDGIVGPTHSFTGQAPGNLASKRSLGNPSNPQAAALQGLHKMRLVASLGIPQAVLPPHERPNLQMARRLGFTGSDHQVLAELANAPALLSACSSAASMWAANAATITPSTDAADGKVHITAANLASALHRSLEPPQTSRVLRAVFHDDVRFVHHEPLPSSVGLCDEGAANQVRLANRYGQHGIHLFAFGRYGLDASRPLDEANPEQRQDPQKLPPRQTQEASLAVARLHAIPLDDLVLARQDLAAIDAGVFHNDVISTGNESVFLYHEGAFHKSEDVISKLRNAFSRVTGGRPLYARKITGRELLISEAVDTYLFNSQIVTRPDGRMTIIAARECEESPRAREVLESIRGDDNPIDDVVYEDLTESMNNGGGPACLRLRAVLTPDEMAHVRQGVLLTPELAATLAAWIEKHYRDRLTLDDLGDIRFLEEGRRALDELTHILGLGSIYRFQMT